MSKWSELTRAQREALQAFLYRHTIAHVRSGDENVEPYVRRIESAINEAREILFDNQNIEDLNRPGFLGDWFS